MLHFFNRYIPLKSEWKTYYRPETNCRPNSLYHFQQLRLRPLLPKISSYQNAKREKKSVGFTSNISSEYNLPFSLLEL